MLLLFFSLMFSAVVVGLHRVFTILVNCKFLELLLKISVFVYFDITEQRFAVSLSAIIIHYKKQVGCKAGIELPNRNHVMLYAASRIITE